MVTPLPVTQAENRANPAIADGDVLAYYDHLAFCLKRVDVTAQDGAP